MAPLLENGFSLRQMFFFLVVHGAWVKFEEGRSAGVGVSYWLFDFKVT